MNSAILLNEILKKELKPYIKKSKMTNEQLQKKIAIAQKNLNEARTESILRKKRLLEYKTASNITDPNFRPKKPWTDVKAESTLKTLGAKPYRLGLNPHGYELDTPNDRLWFYSNGEVYSTNQNRSLGYEVAPGNAELEIWNDVGSKTSKTGFQVGVVKIVGGKPTFVSSEENLEKAGKAKEEPEESSSGWDTFQTILDWAGFIPVIGDAIDVINAIIYFIRGKVTEGLLSLIAVIPLVGSFIKSGIKSIYKFTRMDKLVELVKNSFKSKNTEALWRELSTSGAIKPEHLKDLGTGLGTLNQILKSAIWGVKKIPFIKTRDIIKQLDNFSEWMASSSKTIDDLAGASKRAGANTLYKSAESVSKNVGFLRRFGNTISLNLLPKLKRAPFWPEAKLQKIALGLEKRFAREMASDPTKLTTLIKMTPNENTLLRQLTTDLTTRTKNLPAASQAEFFKRMTTDGLVKTVNGQRKITIRSAEDWGKFLELTDIYPATRGMYDAAAQKIINHAKENDSIIWNIFKNDRLNNIKTILSKDIIPDGSNILKELDFTFRKNIDWIWNEMQDAAESFGFKSQDDVNGVVWPAITYGVAEFLPGVYDAGKTVQGWVKGANESPEGAALIDTAAKTLGLSSDADLAYDPEASKGGTYK